MQNVNFDKISASLGSLLLLWASIERAARDEVIAVYGHLPKSSHGIAATLRTWEATVVERQPATSLCPSLATTLRADLQGPLDIRNGLCHGLDGISAAQGDAPATLRWEMNGRKHSISWEELQASFGWLSKVRSAFSIISSPSLERLGSRGIDNEENRQWWLAEYGLDLARARIA